METIDYFFIDMGVMLGRSMGHIFRSRNSMITVTIITMPIAFMLLFVYVFGCAIQTLEEIFLAIDDKKEEN